jgi:hypothetical protein
MSHGQNMVYAWDILLLSLLLLLLLLLLLYIRISIILYIIIYICVLMWDLNQQQWEYDGNKPSKWLLTGGFMVI